MLRRFLRKFFWKSLGALIAFISFVNMRAYMRCYLWYLRKRGMKIEGVPRYISPTASFDGTDYALISVGHNAVISSNVRALTHDYSLSRAFIALGIEMDTEVSNVRPIVIGDNCFVGTRSILMPGCTLGKNVIVGAGSVVRGDIPDNAMILGNPAQIVGDTLEWGRSRLHLLEENKLQKDPAWWGTVREEAGKASLASETPAASKPQR